MTIDFSGISDYYTRSSKYFFYTRFHKFRIGNFFSSSTEKILYSLTMLHNRVAYGWPVHRVAVRCRKKGNKKGFRAVRTIRFTDYKLACLI